MSDSDKTNAAKSLAFCSLFESELLVLLMLRNWMHPLSECEDHRTQLLETAAEVLAAAAESQDQVFIQGMPAPDMNLVSAVWYAEYRALEEETNPDSAQSQARREWLEAVRRTLPSCFCPQDDLS